MEATRLAPSVGIVASALVLFVLTVPYALVEAGSAVATYYASGAVNPLVVGLFAPRRPDGLRRRPTGPVTA